MGTGERREAVDRQGPVVARRPGIRRVTVLACGEPERGDDGAALAAVASLPPTVVARIDVVPCGQLEVDHLLAVPDDRACIVADAAMGMAPGEVVVVTLEAIAARAGLGAPRSSHTLPPDQAIALATALRGHPLEGVFVGIGGFDFSFGADLSPAVRAGLPSYVDALVAEVLRLAAEAEPGRGQE